MMQSQVAAGKLSSVLRNQFLPRIGTRNLGAITGGGKTADQETNDASEVAKVAPPANTRSGFIKPTTTKDGDPYVSPRIPSYPPSESCPKVQSTGVNQPPEPLAQQKRRRIFFYSVAAVDIDCVGLDGSPLPEEADEELNINSRRRQKEEQEKDNKEYFDHHRASPLSELKIADTRKPIARATTGTAERGYFGTPEVEVWRPEQVDTAEDSLRRAREIWRSNAMRGDPDSPHGRILRTLRGEDW